MITRNKETSRFESVKAPVTEEIAEARSYGYYSKVLNKPFDTLKELQDAEAAFRKAEEEKKKALEVKKAEAGAVEKSIDLYEAGKVACNDTIKAAYKVYREKVEDAEKALDALREDADKKLNEYLKTHEQFHYSYRSEDGKVSRDYSYYNTRHAIFDNYNKFLQAVNDLWKF